MLVGYGDFSSCQYCPLNLSSKPWSVLGRGLLSVFGHHIGNIDAEKGPGRILVNTTQYLYKKNNQKLTGWLLVIGGLPKWQWKDQLGFPVAASHRLLRKGKFSPHVRCSALLWSISSLCLVCNRWLTISAVSFRGARNPSSMCKEGIWWHKGRKIHWLVLVVFFCL